MNHFSFADSKQVTDYRTTINERRIQNPMPVGTLLTAFAYEVAPRQPAPFAGGKVTASTQLQAALDQIYDRSKVGTAPAVTFSIDTTSGTRSHPIRDAARTVAFAGGQHEAAIEGLAARLADSMDHRSKASLMMVTVHQASQPNERRVVIWTFPQQQVFNLSVSGKTATLELTEAFNRESSLRKIAMLQGPDSKTGMLTARVLDFQASAAERAIADLWITRFLDACLQMNATEGTRLLARSLRAAHTKTRDDHDAQDQIVAAITGLRQSNQARSLAEVASTYLSGSASAAFLHGVTPEERNALFTVDKGTFDQLIQYKRFTLETGIVVSVPFAELDTDDVHILDVDGRRRIRVEGDIEEEQVRTRV